MRKALTPKNTRTPLRALAVAGLSALLLVTTAFAAPLSADGKRPYDDKLLRLSEILGAIHYLRELCGSDDGQLWREQMRGLIKAEGSSALRRATFTRKFNQGYRSYSRTYNSCTPSAKTSIERFIAEAVEISEGLVKSVP